MVRPADCKSVASAVGVQLPPSAPSFIKKGFDMEDPCNECLVNTCCTQICDNKRDYGELCIRDLTKFINTYINEDIILTTSLWRKKIKLSSKCKKNNRDVMDIYERSYNARSLR